MMTLALALSLVSGGGGKIDWQRGAREAPLESAIRKARESGGVVLAYFTADWWGFCTKLDAGAFSHDEVVKLSTRFQRALIDCTDKAFYREMTRKHSLQGLPTLAFFDADGRKIDEIAGYTPDAKVYLRLMTQALGPAPSQDERVERILRRIDRELRDTYAKLREEILQSVRDEIAKAKSAGPSFEQRIDAFAARLKQDGGLHDRLRAVLRTAEGKEFVRAAMEQQGVDELDAAIEMYFERDSAGVYSLRPEMEEAIRAWLDEVAPERDPVPPKTRAYLGITPDDFSDDQRRKLGLEKGHGIRILEVAKEGPAEKAGVRPGDVLLSIGDKKVGDENILTVLDGLRPGDHVGVVVLRKSEKVKLEVTLGEKRE